jgi:hypothetical protein
VHLLVALRVHEDQAGFAVVVEIGMLTASTYAFSSESVVL